MLQNWRSASNAEMFPAGFRALGLGKVIGTPTMGAVIGTGSYSLIDGSSIRTPGVGVFLADTARTNMENHAVQPDVYVENTPEDNLAGRDRQLEMAVREVMKDLKPSRVGRQDRQEMRPQHSPRSGRHCNSMGREPHESGVGPMRAA